MSAEKADLYYRAKQRVGVEEWHENQPCQQTSQAKLNEAIGISLKKHRCDQFCSFLYFGLLYSNQHGRENYDDHRGGQGRPMLLRSSDGNTLSTA